MDIIPMGLKRIKPTISITHYNRPDYSEQCLYYLSKCYNIEEYIVHNTIDFYSTEMSEKIVAACQKHTGVNQLFTVHKKRVGLLKNIYYGYKYCFKILQSKFCIHSDDDNIFGRDALYFYEYYLKNYRDTPFIFPSAYTHYPLSHDINEIDETQLRIQHISEPTIALTKDNFLKLEKMNALLSDDNISPGMLMIGKFAENGITEYYTLAAKISRANNIGREGGTFVLSPEHFDKLGQNLPVWIESFDHKPVRNFKCV